MNLLTTGEVRKLFDPPLAESRIRNRLRGGLAEPKRRVAGRFLWTRSEVSSLAAALALPDPTSKVATEKEAAHA